MSIEPADLALSILLAPAWARVGLTAADRRLREAAALELATTIARVMDGGAAYADARQLGLPL